MFWGYGSYVKEFVWLLALVVYEFADILRECPSNNNSIISLTYIGYIPTTLSRRLTCHLLTNSSVKSHITNGHKNKNLTNPHQ